MMVAGLCFAAVNSLSQYVSFKLGLASTQVAFHQYLIALICLLPWLVRHGLRQSLMTNQFRLHLLRVLLAVIGIQLWLWALAYPVPIWQGIALLMTSPLFATLGSALLLKEQVSRARILATLAGFAGAMLILAPWTDEFNWASLLPVAAALFWAGYSLMVRYQAANESSHTIVVYLLIFSTPFNVMLALREPMAAGSRLRRVDGTGPDVHRSRLQRGGGLLRTTFRFCQATDERAGGLAGIWLGPPRPSVAWRRHHHWRHYLANPSGAACSQTRFLRYAMRASFFVRYSCDSDHQQ